VPADVSKVAGIEELVNMVTKSEKSRGGGKTGVDILVANAGATCKS
jgi:NAD(P)-dependent dehydrogenase (short-subunit alcohol dehydrogenase family)